MTGNQMYTFMLKELDLAYTGYIAVGAEANTWFRKGFIETIQHIYREQLNDQNAFDEINYLIATASAFPINNNQIYLNRLLISNVAFLITVITITTELPHNLIVGDSVTTSGIAGFASNNPNGTFTITATPTTTSFTFTAATPTGGPYTANSGYLTSPKMISDYMHYLDYGIARFSHPTTFTVTTSTNSSPIRITLGSRSPFRSKDQITIAGITGNTNANGTFYLRQANELQYFLYTDINLSTPVAGNGTQGGVGTVTQVFNSAIKFKRSQEKASIYGRPTAENPYFQQSDMLLKILPANEVCSLFTLDYIRKPSVFIDSANITIDLSDHYPEFLQYRIISETGKLINASMRDQTGMAIENDQVVENP